MKNRNRKRSQRRMLQIESLERREYMDAGGLSTDHFMPDPVEYLLLDNVPASDFANMSPGAIAGTDFVANWENGRTNESQEEARPQAENEFHEDGNKALAPGGFLTITVQSPSFVVSVIIYAGPRMGNSPGRPNGLPRNSDLPPPNGDIVKSYVLPHGSNENGSTFQARQNVPASPYQFNQSHSSANPYSLIAMNSASSVVKSAIEALQPTTEAKISNAEVRNDLALLPRVQTTEPLNELLDTFKNDAAYENNSQAFEHGLSKLREAHSESTQLSELKFLKRARESLQPADIPSSPAVRLESDGLIALSAPMELLPTVVQQVPVQLPSAEFTWTQRIAMTTTGNTGRSVKQDYDDRSKVNLDSPIKLAQSEETDSQLAVKSVVPVAMSFVMIAWYQRHKRQHPIRLISKLLWQKLFRHPVGKTE